MELAHAAFEAGRYHDSLSRFSKLLERLPDNAAVLCARSAALKKLGRWPQAILDAEHALQVSPRGEQQIEPLYRLACALRSSGNAGRAKEVVVLALALQPDDEPKRALSELFQQCESTLRDQMPSVAVRNSRVQVRCPRRTRKRISPRGLEGRSPRDAAVEEPVHDMAPPAPVVLAPPDPTVWARPMFVAFAWFFFLFGWVLRNVLGLEMLPLEVGELGQLGAARAPNTQSKQPEEDRGAAEKNSAAPNAASTDATGDTSLAEEETTSVSVLPSDLLGYCLAPLTLLDLLSSRCVNQSWFEQSALHLPTRSKLPEGIYLFAATCIETGLPNPSAGPIGGPHQGGAPPGQTQEAGGGGVQPVDGSASGHTTRRLQSAGCLTFCADGLDGDWSSVRGNLVSEEDDTSSTDGAAGSSRGGSMVTPAPSDRHEVFGRWLPDGSVNLWWVRASAVDGRPERISHELHL